MTTANLIRIVIDVVAGIQVSNWIAAAAARRRRTSRWTCPAALCSLTVTSQSKASVEAVRLAHEASAHTRKVI